MFLSIILLVFILSFSIWHSKMACTLAHSLDPSCPCSEPHISQPLPCTRCDAGMASETAAAAQIERPRSLLTGLLHAGGILHDAPLRSQNPALVREVFGPKAHGAQALLQHAARAMPVLHALLFSSIAALTGPAGSANYAAANAVCDSLASQAQAQGTLSAASAACTAKGACASHACARSHPLARARQCGSQCACHPFPIRSVDATQLTSKDASSLRAQVARQQPLDM